jgi:threonine dehydratase
MNQRPTIDDIRDARERIREHVHMTPLEHSSEFSRLLGNQIYHKLENLQMTGSFKVRGALNAVLTLGDAQRDAGVIAASAGNHAQGLAHGARIIGIKATIVMPVTTPLVKLEAVKRNGAEVIRYGESYDESAAHAFEIAQSSGAHMVHPFNDPAVIAGQGTIALEILEQFPDVDAVIVPVGGGGLISGIGTVLKSLAPRVQVIGVQASGADSMAQSLAAGDVRTLDRAVTIADGIRVATPGDLTLDICRDVVDQLVTVDDDDIANAVLMMVETDKSVVEGAGATPLAALLQQRVGLRGKKVLLVVSGGNIDVNVLSRIIERGLVKTGRLIRIKATLADRPGSLTHITNCLAEMEANVITVSHDRAFAKNRLDETQVEFSLETRGSEHAREIVQSLENSGYIVDVLQ